MFQPTAEVDAINATVKSVKTGNWKIEVIDGWEPPYIDNGKENKGHSDIYVSISENSAEWRVNPSFDALTLRQRLRQNRPLHLKIDILPIMPLEQVI